MKLFKTILAISVLLITISCQSKYESQGHSAYKKSQKATGNTKRTLQKTAYILYSKALKETPTKVTPLLRDRFMEMTLVRAEMVLDEGSSTNDAIPLYMNYLDSSITPETNQTIKDRYATFITALADSSFAKRKLYKGLDLLDKAMGLVADKSDLEKKKTKILDNFGKENYEAAEIELLNGEANEDSENLIRAEFFIKVALLYDKNYPGAKKMLSKIRKLNAGTYSAYEAVILDKPDTTIYKKINNLDILIAIPKVVQSRKNALLEVEIYNYSYNPIRLKPENFFIVDSKGKKFKALKTSKIEKELLDQEHETKMKLKFKKGSAKIRKLIYESKVNGDHFTEKYLY